jgi:hypothetical protein
MNKCPACQSLKIKIDLSIDNYPLSIFPQVSEEAIRLPKDKILLFKCNDCGHNFLQNKEHLDYIYDYAYKNYPHQYNSETFSYREEFFKFFSQFKDFKNVDLLEIGSNNYNNLLNFVEIARSITGISLEASPQQYENMELIQGSFETFNFDKKYTIILSRFVLEHIYDLVDHLNRVHKILSIDGYLFIQVPNPSKMRDSNVFNVLAHEHLHYFTENSLRFLFSQNGFEILKFMNGNSFLICAKRSERTKKLIEFQNSNIDFNYPLFDVQRFEIIGNFLVAEIENGRKPILYGAGLNLIGLFLVRPGLGVNQNLLIVDDNRLVIGKCMPNSNIRIMKLDQIQIDDSSCIVLLANRTYQRLIIERIQELGLRNRVFDSNLSVLAVDN